MVGGIVAQHDGRHALEEGAVGEGHGQEGHALGLARLLVDGVEGDLGRDVAVLAVLDEQGGALGPLDPCPEASGSTVDELVHPARGDGPLGVVRQRLVLIIHDQGDEMAPGVAARLEVAHHLTDGLLREGDASVARVVESPQAGDLHLAGTIGGEVSRSDDIEELNVWH